MLSSIIHVIASVCSLQRKQRCAKLSQTARIAYGNGFLSFDRRSTQTAILPSVSLSANLARLSLALTHLLILPMRICSLILKVIARNTFPKARVEGSSGRCLRATTNSRAENATQRSNGRFAADWTGERVVHVALCRVNTAQSGTEQRDEKNRTRTSATDLLSNSEWSDDRGSSERSDRSYAVAAALGGLFGETTGGRTDTGGGTSHGPPTATSSHPHLILRSFDYTLRRKRTLG